MPTKHRALAALLFAAAAGGALAATPPAVREEIDALLGRLQASGCEFNRNGAWHSSADAKSHLARKLDYIDGKKTLQNTEQFIDLAAAASSSSGKPYQVRCPGAAPVPSKQWLSGELAAIRAARGASK